MTRTTWIATAAVALLLPAAGTALAAEPPATSSSYAFATYSAWGDDVKLLVSTQLASLRRGDAFIPVPVAVGLFGTGKSITITAESFVLVDSAGHRYVPPAYTDLVQRYDKLRFDQEVLRARPLSVGLEFESLHRMRSNFFPAPGTLRYDRVSLAPFGWFSDVIYFPRPATLEGVLTLELHAEGLATPVTARVVVPGVAKRVPATAS